MLLWCFLGAATVPLLAQQVQAKHARVELLARESSATPGGQLLIGVHFLLQPGWHIYWVNPGDSGQPPSFQWHLPEGFSAGAIEWPRPERMQSTPELADYGYHDDVLLMVPIKAAQFINISSRLVLEFSVEAKWLICSEVCLPDHAQLHGSWSAGGENNVNPATVALFTRAQQLLPKPLPLARIATAFSHSDTFVLILETHPLTGSPQFFPLNPGQVDNASPQSIEGRPRGVKITLKKSDLLLKPISVLRGVLVLPGDGIYQVEVPVVAGKGIK